MMMMMMIANILNAKQEIKHLIEMGTHNEWVGMIY